jgi:predicted RNA polymerase sigma factor
VYAHTERGWAAPPDRRRFLWKCAPNDCRALMLLQESRGVARTTTAGDPTRRPGPFTLEQGYQVAEGLTLAERALFSRRFGPDTLLAAIRRCTRRRQCRGNRLGQDRLFL